MRKLFHFSLPLLLSFILINPSQAQIELGVYGGGDLSALKGDPPPGGRWYVPEWGFQVGAKMDVRITEDVYISFQPAYNIHGGKVQFWDFALAAWEDSLDLDLETLQFPVLLQLVSNNQRWQFSTGLMAGILLNAKVSDGETKQDLEKTETFNPSILFGAGYRIPIGKGKLSIDFRYTQGFGDITNTSDDPNSPVPRIKSIGYQFLMFYDIPIGKKKE